MIAFSHFRRLHTSLWALWVVVPLVAGAACVGNISKSTYDVLEDLYNDLGGDYWSWNYSDTQSIWTFPSELSVQCASTPWQQITCESVSGSSNCEVMTLDLQSFNLAGPLPDSLDGLSYLNTLLLGMNEITGPLSETIFETMENLTEFAVDDNHMTGAVPLSLLQLPQLISMSISFNHFDTLPDEIDLPNIQIFSAFMNRFHGDLPLSVVNQTSLQELDLSFNLFDGTFPCSQYASMHQLVALALDLNFLEGALCAEIGVMTNLTLLELSNNRFSGSLPSTVGNLKKLSTFTIYVNSFQSTIPSEVGQMIALTYLQLNANNFSGSFPTEIGLLTNLYVLCAEENSFQGAMPTELGKLQNLQQLTLQYNQMSQMLPTELGLLTALQKLYLYYNNLSGVIPTEFGNMHSIERLMLFENSLVGSLPSQIYSLTTLQQFNVDNNDISGTLSSAVGNLSNLNFWSVSYNNMTGTLPSELGLLINLQQLSVDSNRFHSTLPSELAVCTLMKVLELAYNDFSSTIPDALFAGMSNLSSIFLNGNQLTGVMPWQLASSSISFVAMSENFLTGPVADAYFQLRAAEDLDWHYNLLTSLPAQHNFTMLESLSINGNLITGSLPYLQGLKRLEAIICENNYFSGTIGNELSSNHKLEALDFGANILSGALPPDLAGLIRLQVLNMSYNFFTGQIVELFENASSFRNLQILDLSRNGLSGSIPDSVFKPREASSGVRLLSVVVLYNNCFEGTLPESICTSPQLTTLVLDAVGSSPACRKTYPPPLSYIVKAVVSKKLLDGTIPTCIWTMPSLVTLHLSGNGIQGTLGDLVQGVTNLQDVSLSNNRLVGSIPASWQTWGQFTQLDLSSNKFCGTLSDQFTVGPSSTNTDLTVNRLSGNVPSTLRNADDIDILQGNLFQCSSSTVPESDPDKDSYVCGSSDFDIYLIVWLCVFSAVVVGGRLSYSLISKLLENAEDVRIRSYNHDLSSTSAFLDFISRISRSCAIIGLLSVLFAMTMFVAFKLSNQLSVYYSTHSVQYAWVTTVAYLHGIAPTIVVVVLLYVVVAVVDVWLAVPFSAPIATYWWQTVRGARQCTIDRQAIMNFVLVSTVIIIHMVITIVVNVFYVYALIIGVSATAVTLLQGAMSIFKLSWNSGFVVWALKRLKLSNENHLICATFMVLFTFLVSPFVATFFSDTSCFRYVITSTPTVTSSFLSNQFGCSLLCLSYGDDEVKCLNECKVSELADVEVITSVTPSWLYSYQCSSRIITNYAPVLMFAYTISGIIIPAFHLLFLTIPSQIVEKYVPNFIRKKFMNNMYGSRVQRLDDNVSCSSNPLNPPDNLEISAQSMIDQSRTPTRAFNPYTMLSRYLLNVAVLGTFGLASPLLCVAVVLDAWSVLIIFRILIIRFVRMYQSNEADAGKIDTSICPRKSSLTLVADGNRPFINSLMHEDNLAKGVLERTTRDVLAGLPLAVWMVVVMLVMFWSFFVYDMMGDVYGVNIGALAILLPSVGTVVVHSVATYYTKVRLINSNRVDNGLSTSLLLEAGDIGLNESFASSSNSKL
jgi:Leucine-rich repeat (LRR) protein